MKKLSDYKGDEAIELLADLMEPIALILADDEIQTVIKSNRPPIFMVKTILKKQKKQAIKILERIDETPVNGLNIITRLVSLITEIMNDETIKDFFNSQGQKTEDTSSGSVMENIEEEKISNVSSNI